MPNKLFLSMCLIFNLSSWALPNSFGSAMLTEPSIKLQIDDLKKSRIFLCKAYVWVESYFKTHKLSNESDEIKFCQSLKSIMSKAPLKMISVSNSVRYQRESPLFDELYNYLKSFCNLKDELIDYIQHCIKSSRVKSAIKILIEFYCDQHRHQSLFNEALYNQLMKNDSIQDKTYAMECKQGNCYGLSVLWSYGQLLLQSPGRGHDDGYSFRDAYFSTLLNALDFDNPFVSFVSAQETKNAQKFINHIAWFQRNGGAIGNNGLRQGDLAFKLNDINHGFCKSLKSVTGFCTPQILKNVLTEIFIKPGQVLIMSVNSLSLCKSGKTTGAHSVALSTDSWGNFTYYDPNNSNGAFLMAHQDIDCLVDLLFELSAFLSKDDYPKNAYYFSFQAYGFKRKGNSYYDIDLSLDDFLPLFTDELAKEVISHKPSVGNVLLRQLGEENCYALIKAYFSQNTKDLNKIKIKSIIFWLLNKLFVHYNDEWCDEDIDNLVFIRQHYFKYMGQWSRNNPKAMSCFKHYF